MSRTQLHTYSSVQPRGRVQLDDEMMREILVDVGGMRTALELELWASWILGQTWKQRVTQPQFAEVDWMLTLGAPMVTMIARIGGARARKALSAISMLERGALGNYAGAVALSLPGARTPAWMAEIADARFASARHIQRVGDGEIVLLDLDRRGRQELTVGVFIDEHSDGAVKWMRLLGPAGPQPVAGSVSDELEPADLPEIADRVSAAIERTDRNPRFGPGPGEVADLRAFVLARLLDARSGA